MRLALQLPADGTVASLRLLLDPRDAHIDIGHIWINTPDLNDVFFAVTGRATAGDLVGQ